MRNADETVPGIAAEAICFSSFRLDPRAGRLTCDGEAIPLRPKTWSVLLHLAQRPGVLVSKDELLDAVWPNVAVTPDTLTKSIGELRLALNDDSRTPRFIETVHRRGFRFIGGIHLSSSRPVAATAPGEDHRGAAVEAAPTACVGRAAELQRLQALLAKAQAGERQIVFVTGPAGIGKSTLIETFLTRCGGDARLWVGRGTCVEQHGAREAYMPVLEALERLARRPDGDHLTPLLRRDAPTWLMQIPWLIGDDAEPSRQSLQTARPERMLREFAALIEALAADRTVALVFEDLHWSDPSTVDLLTFLAQRREPARLLVVGSFRPAEVAVQEHSLGAAVHMLKARKRCVQVPVHELTRDDGRAYLEHRFPGALFAPELGPILHHHTDGNPLFMTAVVDHMLSRGLILDTTPGWALGARLERVDLGIPDEVGQMIEAQIETLAPADRELLEVASVSGLVLVVPAIAGVLDADVEGVELRCEALARARRFLRTAGRSEWPDGSVARRYSFTHELYRRVIYAGIPDRQRLQRHRRLAEVLETAYAERAGEIAPELVFHFESGRDYVRAIHYLGDAAERARQRFANREALGYLESALENVGRLSDPELRQRQELEVRFLLGRVLADLHGYASDALRESYERADRLCAEVGGAAEAFEIVYALAHGYAAGGSLAADATSLRLDALAAKLGTAQSRLRADSVLVRIGVVAGRFVEAEARMRRFPPLVAERPADEWPEFGPDPVIDAYSHQALGLWFLGDVERAQATSRAAVAAARAAEHGLTLAAALSHGGVLAVLGGDAARALSLAEEAARMCDEQGFDYWHAMASAVRGQARILRGESRAGVDELTHALGALRATGTQIFSTHILAFLADAHRRAGRLAEGLAAANEGVEAAESSLDRTYRPELWRLKGELLWMMAESATRGRRSRAARAESPRAEAERCLLHAWELARENEARSLELRAAISLARLWKSSRREADAIAVLTPVCEWFGRDAQGKSLDDARALLDEPRRPGRRRA